MEFHGNQDATWDIQRTTIDVVERGGSVWCTGEGNIDRVCHFHNLCYAPTFNSFVLLHGMDTIIDGIPEDRYTPALLDLSSVRNHNTQYFHYVDVPVNGLNHFEQVVMHRGAHFMFNRFNPSNLMHVLHDDLLPVYHTLLKLGLLQQEALKPSARLVFLEGWHQGDFYNLYQWMSVGQPLLMEDFTQEDDKTLVCFEDAYLGISKTTTWYQYGFDIPQGPIPDVTVTAREIRMFTNALMRSFGSHGDSSSISQACLLTRETNRLILNQADVISAIAQRTGFTTVKISLDDLYNPTETSDDINWENISILSNILQDIQRCKVVVGMHGSLLALTMFLHPGSKVIELFPYAVNPDQYTPYKTLANLPGMQIKYASWRNSIPENTVTHPDASPEQGGLMHFSVEEQQRIMGSEEVPPHLCCSDPEWLYRIYQDTVVDIPSFISVMSDILHDEASPTEGRMEEESNTFPNKALPGKVQNLTCQTFSADDKFGLALSWQPPWNVKFFDETIQIRYEVWIQERGREEYSAWILEMTEYVFTEGLDAGKLYKVWIRCLVGDKTGPFAPVVLC